MIYLRNALLILLLTWVKWTITTVDVINFWEESFYYLLVLANYLVIEEFRLICFIIVTCCFFHELVMSCKGKETAHSILKNNYIIKKEEYHHFYPFCRLQSSLGITTFHSPSSVSMYSLKYASVLSLISWNFSSLKSVRLDIFVLTVLIYFYTVHFSFLNSYEDVAQQQLKMPYSSSSLNFAMLLEICSNVTVHYWSFWINSFFSIVEAKPSRR